MTTFKMTFNKPAASQFIEGYEAKGLEIKVDNEKVMFRPTRDHDGENAAILSKRMRGGYETTIEGTNANSLLICLQNPSGPFFTLQRNAKHPEWAECIPYHGEDAPPKFTPHVRIWNLDKEDVPPTKIVTPPVNDFERVKWAYEKLKEPARAGRPSNEVIEARHIKAAFENATKKSSVNLETIIEASAIIQAFITDALKEMGKDEAISNQNSAEARHALGMDEKPREVTKHISPNADLRSFGGGLADKMAEGVLEKTS